MADSRYEILEYRCYIKEDVSELYIRISNPTDFLPIGGWYKKSISRDEATLEVLQQDLLNQAFLVGKEWKREAPPSDASIPQLHSHEALEVLTLCSMALAAGIRNGPQWIPAREKLGKIVESAS